MDKTKRCISCGEELPISKDYFHKQPGGKDGYKNKCKECIKSYNEKYYHDNKEYFKKHKKNHYQENKKYYQESWEKWYEKNKEERKEYCNDYYHKNKEYYRELGFKYREANKKHIRSVRRRYYLNNKGRELELNKKWHKNNPEARRAIEQRRKANAAKVECNLTIDEWEDAMEFFNYSCCYCGSEKTLEQDHLIALSKGGGYTRGNIVPACKSCNSSKGNKDFEIWYRDQECFDAGREEKIIQYIRTS